MLKSQSIFPLLSSCTGLCKVSVTWAQDPRWASCRRSHTPRPFAVYAMQSQQRLARQVLQLGQKSSRLLKRTLANVGHFSSLQSLALVEWLCIGAFFNCRTSFLFENQQTDHECRFLIQDMTKSDLLAQDKEFEEYLRENGWDGEMNNSKAGL